MVGGDVEGAVKGGGDEGGEEEGDEGEGERGQHRENQPWTLMFGRVIKIARMTNRQSKENRNNPKSDDSAGCLLRKYGPLPSVVSTFFIATKLHCA